MSSVAVVGHRSSNNDEQPPTMGYRVLLHKSKKQKALCHSEQREESTTSPQATHSLDSSLRSE